MKYAFEVPHSLRNRHLLTPMKGTGIEEDGQAVSRKRPGREYVDLVALELAHIFFPAVRRYPVQSCSPICFSRMRGSQRQLCQDSNAGLDQSFFE
jgi:hypothetical protein